MSNKYNKWLTKGIGASLLGIAAGLICYHFNMPGLESILITFLVCWGIIGIIEGDSDSSKNTD